MFFSVDVGSMATPMKILLRKKQAELSTTDDLQNIDVYWSYTNEFPGEGESESDGHF